MQFPLLLAFSLAAAQALATPVAPDGEPWTLRRRADAADTAATASDSPSAPSTETTSSSTSTTTPDMQHYNHVGNTIAIAVCSCIGGVTAVVLLALALRRRLVRRRRADQKALLAAGSSAYSMVPVPEDQAASAGEGKFDRLSMMFSDEPTRLSAAGGPAQATEVTVHATPLQARPVQRAEKENRERA